MVIHSGIVWHKPDTLPRNTEGQYLVWLHHAEKRYGSTDEVQVYTALPCSNGILRMCGGHFASDYLDDVTITAWDGGPMPPDWIETR